MSQFLFQILLISEIYYFKDKIAVSVHCSDETGAFKIKISNQIVHFGFYTILLFNF